jgi:hypothetical protein
MTQTILQKIDAERVRVKAYCRRTYENCPIIDDGDSWVIKYPSKYHSDEWDIAYCGGPVTLDSLSETVKELQAEGITEACWEAEYCCYESKYDFENGDGFHGDWAQVDLAPLFKGA